MKYPETICIPNNPGLRSMAGFLPDITYSRAGGEELKLNLVLPWMVEGQPLPKRPLIVFIQGSAWTTPDLNWQLPQLGRYAQFGQVVATIGHRDNTKGHPFPAYLQDVKTAIRYLRANAAVYGIDRERVCLFGTSSGGNAALLAALTPDDPRYETGEFAGESDAVNCVISCFGPTDMKALIHGHEDEFRDSPTFSGLVGEADAGEVARLMSPILEVKPGKKHPAFLLCGGDADELVPFYQAEAMYRRLIDEGCKAQLIKVIGAPHEGSFWSNRLYGLIADFLRENL